MKETKITVSMVNEEVGKGSTVIYLINFKLIITNIKSRNLRNKSLKGLEGTVKTIV